MLKHKIKARKLMFLFYLFMPECTWERGGVGSCVHACWTELPLRIGPR